MVYIAEKKTVPVLGQEFESYLDSDGSVVFSQVSAAKGLGITEQSVRRLRKSKQLETLMGEGLSVRRLRANTGNSVQAIAVITMKSNAPNSVKHLVCSLTQH